MKYKLEDFVKGSVSLIFQQNYLEEFCEYSSIKYHLGSKLMST